MALQVLLKVGSIMATLSHEELLPLLFFTHEGHFQHCFTSSAPTPCKASFMIEASVFSFWCLCVDLFLLPINTSLLHCRPSSLVLFSSNHQCGNPLPMMRWWGIVPPSCALTAVT